MNTVLNISEMQLEGAIASRIETAIKSLIHNAIHTELANASKRHISNGVWEPVQNSVASKMWKAFDEGNLNLAIVDFKKITIIAMSNNWPYKSTFREYERWRAFKGN